MKRGFLIFLLTLLLGGYIVAGALSKEVDDGFCYTNFNKKELLKDLSYAEKQVFESTYTSDTITERLERLELEVFGAIQEGQEDWRIKKIKKSVTNVSSGGYGLNKSGKVFNLGENVLGTTNWAIGNMHNFYPYTNSYYLGRNNTSHRIQTPYSRHSHRLPPPPPPPNYNSSPISSGNFMKNYSIGTGIKILDD